MKADAKHSWFYKGRTVRDDTHEHQYPTWYLGSIMVLYNNLYPVKSIKDSMRCANLMK